MPARRLTLVVAATQVAIAALLGGLVELALLYSGAAAPPSWVAALFAIGAWVYAGAGVVAWLRRPSSLMGLLMTAGAFLLAQGRSNAAIAELLGVSEKAVVRHTSNIYDELGLDQSPGDHRRVLAVVRFLSA